MQRQPDKKEQHEFDAKGYDLFTAGAQCWNYGIGSDFMSPNVLSGSTLDVASANQINTCWGSPSCESQANGGQISVISDSVCRREHGSVASSMVSPVMGQYLMQEPQRDHIGSLNMVPELNAVPHYRTTSPCVLPEEPVYVNAKQYHGILRRRQLRAKAELENKVTRSRKPYLHESRHLHALRRARGCGGRFINTKKSDSAADKATRDKGNGAGDSSPLKPLRPADSGYASMGSSGLGEPSTSRNEFKRFSLDESKDVEFFQWSRHKSFLSQ
ncbi:hypothetical protein CDL12_10663 [Handroanthus impetiginosus]|uniref:Nuclear transcription factor Y subunit n=1 Tax=Handroanthus impetiginosus TaxID=429701 RepID=A0A2G9HGS5_9LAMI|nr:hypothetical protein CDL12_10663 [Handroanthus impetiginosus]